MSSWSLQQTRLVVDKNENADDLNDLNGGGDLSLVFGRSSTTGTDVISPIPAADASETGTALLVLTNGTKQPVVQPITLDRLSGIAGPRTIADLRSSLDRWIGRSVVVRRRRLEPVSGKLIGTDPLLVEVGSGPASRVVRITEFDEISTPTPSSASSSSSSDCPCGCRSTNACDAGLSLLRRSTAGPIGIRIPVGFTSAVLNLRLDRAAIDWKPNFVVILSGSLTTVRLLRQDATVVNRTGGDIIRLPQLILRANPNKPYTRPTPMPRMMMASMAMPPSDAVGQTRSASLETTYPVSVPNGILKSGTNRLPIFELSSDTVAADARVDVPLGSVWTNRSVGRTDRPANLSLRLRNDSAYDWSSGPMQLYSSDRPDYADLVRLRSSVSMMPDVPGRGGTATIDFGSTMRLRFRSSITVDDQYLPIPTTGGTNKSSRRRIGGTEPVTMQQKTSRIVLVITNGDPVRPSLPIRITGSVADYNGAPQVIVLEPPLLDGRTELALVIDGSDLTIDVPALPPRSSGRITFALRSTKPKQ